MQKFFHKLYIAACSPFLRLKKIWGQARLASAVAAVVPGARVSPELGSRIFLSSVYRINSPVRQQILNVALATTLNPLAHSGLTVRVIDASVEEYIPANRGAFVKIPGLELDFQAKALRQAPSVIDVLNKSRQPYFSMVYDDMPVVGYTPEFLTSACDFFDDFKGVVNVMLIELVTRIECNHDKKQIVCDLRTLEFRSRGIKPERVVQYGNYSFAIVKNFHYGFFFNTIVAPAQDYAKRLSWFMNHISEKDSNKIELAGQAFRGPAWFYVAIPLDVFTLDLDFSPTEHSIRSGTAIQKAVYEGLQNGYQIMVVK